MEVSEPMGNLPTRRDNVCKLCLTNMSKLCTLIEHSMERGGTELFSFSKLRSIQMADTGLN